MKKNISIYGGGWVGAPLAFKLALAEFEVTVSASSAHKQAKHPNIKVVEFRAEPNMEKGLWDEMNQSEIKIWAIPPRRKKNSEEFYLQILQDWLSVLDEMIVKKIIFLSSTSIYQNVSDIVDEKSAIVVGFNYHLPFEIKNNMTANAGSSATSPQSVDVTRTDNYSMFNIMANYYYTFVHENTDPFSLHAIVGAGITHATITESFTEYDNSLYNINRNSSGNSHTGPIIDLGIGSNINLDRINIFIDAKMGIPATSSSTNNSTSSNFENPIPFHVSLNAGVRYNLFD